MMTDHASTTASSGDNAHTYALSNNWEHAKERLTALQNACDKTTQSWLEFIKPGDHCLEIGPDNGSMAEWIAAKAACEGHLDVLDIDDKFLTDISKKQNNIKTIHTNVLTYDLGEVQYDLI